MYESKNCEKKSCYGSSSGSCMYRCKKREKINKTVDCDCSSKKAFRTEQQQRQKKTSANASSSSSLPSSFLKKALH